MHYILPFTSDWLDYYDIDKWHLRTPLIDRISMSNLPYTAEWPDWYVRPTLHHWLARLVSQTYPTPLIGWIGTGVEKSSFVGAVLSDLDQFGGDTTQTRG